MIDKYLKVSFTVQLELIDECELEEFKKAITELLTDAPLEMNDSTIYGWAQDVEIKEPNDDRDE